MPARCELQPTCDAGEFLDGGASVTSVGVCQPCPPGSYTDEANNQLVGCKAQPVCNSADDERLVGGTLTTPGKCIGCGPGKRPGASVTSHGSAEVPRAAAAGCGKADLQAAH